MRNEEIKAELSALRAEVLALAEARKQAEAEVGSPSAEASQGGSAIDVATEHDGVMGQIKELVELLEEELKETPVVSGLVIFSVGILVGRFLR
jgi:hypothetical protein